MALETGAIILLALTVLTWLIEAIVPRAAGPVTARLNRTGTQFTWLTTMLCILVILAYLLSQVEP